MEPKDQNYQEFPQEATANVIKPTKRLFSGCPKPPAMQQPYNNCRKTRDLPNLSQCHACGFRVDVCTENRRAISTGKACKTVLDSTSSRVFESGNARVLDEGDCATSMEYVVKDANAVVEKKVKAAERAREVAPRKAVVGLAARKAVELASNALDLIAKRDEHGSVKGCDSDDKIDDVELAFRLHRAMNSSSRSSKTFCPVNSGCVVAMTMRDENAVACRKLEISVDRSASGHPDCVKIGDGDSSSYRDYSKSHPSVYVRRKRKVGKSCDKSNHEDVELNSIEGNGSCSNKLLNSSIGDESLHSESQIYCKQEDCNQPMDARCNGKSDRYFLKYRRKSGDRCFLKYRRKSGWRSRSNGKHNFLYEGVYHQIQASVCELPLNSSRESGFSNCSFQSCVFSLQASPSTNGLSREHSEGAQDYRAMNSSPRSSKTFCPVNSGCVVALTTRDENTVACRKLEISVDRSAPGHPDCVRIGDGDSSSYRDYLKSHRLVYDRRKRKVGKCCDKPDHEDVKVSSIEGNVSCSNKLLNSSIVDESLHSESQIYCKQEDCNQPMDARCNGKSDCYFLKYRRKSDDRCFLKYRRKSGWRSTSNGKCKFLYEGIYQQIQASVSELPLNSSRQHSEGIQDYSLAFPGVFDHGLEGRI
ncbi:uncharacterized protein LOC119984771 isoform X2 [Tripterygium wilfordii]|uniref:uncharacterized protein LOC119984771 isoform X2 n=1 Tax=Tripterygium wilfordii TaxID=458696 RepID=UPI0018F82B10|nr:uncharacterized protein LOC119984771 isoform X2 [Tripterygium wilfordii]